MPRRHRPVIEGIPLHIIQRGNNRLACFHTESDYLIYLYMLGEALVLAGCKLHAYVLMSNHVHLLLTPTRANSAAALMKSVGERYVQYFNRQHKRTGTLWEGRYKSCLVQDDGYLLVCHRYIEMNPVRAKMVRSPVEYRWSSFKRNAHGHDSMLIEPHPLYSSLGNSEADCQQAYRKLFDADMSEEDLRTMRNALNGNSVFGSDEFAKSMETAWGRNILPKKQGIYTN